MHCVCGKILLKTKDSQNLLTSYDSHRTNLHELTLLIDCFCLGNHRVDATHQVGCTFLRRHIIEHVLGTRIIPLFLNNSSLEPGLRIPYNHSFVYLSFVLGPNQAEIDHIHIQHMCTKHCSLNSEVQVFKPIQIVRST